MKKPGPGVQRQYTVADRIYESLVHGEIYNSGEITAPVGGRSVYGTIVSKYVRSLIIDYRFIFKLQLNLRLNITFHHIHIIHHKVKNKCELDYIVVTTFSVEDQVYCGLLSKFIVIPPDNQLIGIEIKMWFPHVYFDVKFFFSVTDPDRVTSETTKQHDIFMFNSWTVYFPQTGLLLQRLILKVKRFLSLKITVRSTIDTEADVYDGPDLFCSKIKPVTTNETEIIHIFITSSFQSIIYLRFFYGSANVTDKKDRIDYISQKHTISKTISFMEDGFHRLSNYDNKCTSNRPVCIIQLQTKQWLYFNITITDMHHNHPVSRLCSYGGVAVYDIINGKHKDISKLCYVHPGNYIYQNIYTNSSDAELVIYSYREYGLFNVTLDVTTTKCQVFTIDVCNVVSKGIQVDSCAIFQLKQKANQIFEEHNLYSDWMFCRSYLTHDLFSKVSKETFYVKFTGKKTINLFCLKECPFLFIT